MGIEEGDPGNSGEKKVQPARVERKLTPSNFRVSHVRVGLHSASRSLHHIYTYVRCIYYFVLISPSDAVPITAPSSFIPNRREESDE